MAMNRKWNGSRSIKNKLKRHSIMKNRNVQWFKKTKVSYKIKGIEEKSKVNTNGLEKGIIKEDYIIFYWKMILKETKKVNL